jgi:hypothetical protein
MTTLPDKLRLKALAEEDIFFAKRDRELIAALHKRKLAKHLQLNKQKARKKAKALQKKYAAVTLSHKNRPQKLARFYRALIKKARKLVSRK